MAIPDRSILPIERRYQLLLEISRGVRSSLDLDEVLELSDRVLVIHRGRIVGEFDAASAERDRIGLLMARGVAA